jgi:pimeloyl-ACP methyl ester carboxylesterase
MRERRSGIDEADGMESIRIGNLDIGYRRAGAGPPVVVLPGAMDDGRWWERQLLDLSADFAVVVWDAPGCGVSTDPPAAWSLADFADCLASLVHALGLAPVHLLGLSFGGALAIEVCSRHPDAVRSLVLTSAYAGWLGSLDAAEARRRVALGERMGTMTVEEFVRVSLPTLVGPATSEPDRQLIERLLRDTRLGSAPTVARALEVDLRAALPTIAVPTLVVHGAQDVRAPRAAADDLVARIPGAEIAIVQAAGHLVNIDAPDQLAAEVRAFLTRHRET